MLKGYVTFGQMDVHHINGQVLDKDCVAVIEISSPLSAEYHAGKMFGNKWCRAYSESGWKPENMKYFKRGSIDLTTDSLKVLK